MNTAQAAAWLPSFLVPFVSISYPTEPPAVPDSFPNSTYYRGGILDLCFIITSIAVMAILRDSLRLGVCEPFAKWYLTRQLRHSKATQNGHANGNGKGAKEKSNGVANGNGNANGYVVHNNEFVISKREARQMRHSVIRFAEQGWPFVYYAAQWGYGLVSVPMSGSLCETLISHSGCICTSQQKSWTPRACGSVTRTSRLLLLSKSIISHNAPFTCTKFSVSTLRRTERTIGR